MFFAWLFLLTATYAFTHEPPPVFHVYEREATFSSIGTTVVGGRPFFAVADWLNPPFYASVYDGNGTRVWRLDEPGDVRVDTARHVNGADAGAVDVFLAVCDEGGPPCTIFGRASAGSTGWTLPLPKCFMGAVGELEAALPALQAADSGRAVAVLCTSNDGAGNSSLTVYFIDGQSGVVAWTYTLNAPYVTVGVQVSSSGSHVLLTNEGATNMAYVLDGATGALLDTLNIPSYLSSAAAISDAGDYIAFANGASNVTVMKLAAGKYEFVYDVGPPAKAPPPADKWRTYDIQISTDPAAAAYLFVSYTPDKPTAVLVGGFALSTGAGALTWASADAAPIQTLPALRADGDLVAVALWGNTTGSPTVVLLRAGLDAPVFAFTTPGSMEAVDLNVVAAADGGRIVYLGAAGCHEYANLGDGGDAYGWTLQLPSRGFQGSR